jgi:hypothetical protein
MKAYIDKLKAKIAEAEHLREQAKAKSRIADMRVSPEWSPLTEQIEALMRNLPPCTTRTSVGDGGAVFAAQRKV